MGNFNQKNGVISLFITKIVFIGGIFFTTKTIVELPF